MTVSATSLGSMIATSTVQDNPISALRRFMEAEATREAGRQVSDMRFVGYVLDLGYDTARIITSDPYKLAVGGIPRGSFLIMTPNNPGDLPPHFTLLRVTGVSATPLSNQVQQTYFELHKKAMPELDVWTQSELQWGALECDVLGMFYADPDESNNLAFSGDVNNVVSAHRYKVYAPDEALLDLIVNGMVTRSLQSELGALRTMECRLTLSGTPPTIPVKISMKDFKGRRTAMFGKTRLGKSNVVKLLAKGMIDETDVDKSVGQLIFDINGEYANTNEQNLSLYSAYPGRCEVYALTQHAETPSRPLRLNFYEQPASCLNILGTMLKQDNQNANYIRSFSSVELPELEDISGLGTSEKVRAIRKVQMYWAILKKANYRADEDRLRALGLRDVNTRDFNPHFASGLRTAAYREVKDQDPPSHPDSLDALRSELEVIAEFRRNNPDHSALEGRNGKSTFDPEDIALLDFLRPGSGSGPSVLRPYLVYHAPDAGNFVTDILALLDAGKTVILDLGNATDEIRRYFADMLSREVFSHQEAKFVRNALGDHFIQIYFEEAHNLFPPDNKDLTGVYARFAKEGAKFHIGMVYSTQSPSTINRELLAQTENFFVGHLSSQDEAKALSRVQVAFSGIEGDILRARTPGLMRMLTMSHRFVIPVQAKLFETSAAAEGEA